LGRAITAVARKDSPMPTILLTGAAGALGTHLRRWFAERGRMVLATDITPPEDGDEVAIADLSDLAAVRRLMEQDIAAVVHFAARAQEDRWQAILDANIVATYNVFEAARRAGVHRVIYASSYHAVGMYPTDELPLDPSAEFRPDTLYGVSKVFGEAVARLYFDKFGIECLVIRICTAGTPGTPREARLWCNRDDLARLVEAGLDAPALGYRMIYGISNNPNAPVPIAGEGALGWRPEHGAEELGGPSPHAPLDPADPSNERLGGGFAQWGHFDD
jgi:uronate dehydrogenase